MNNSSRGRWPASSCPARIRTSTRFGATGGPANCVCKIGSECRGPRPLLAPFENHDCPLELAAGSIEHDGQMTREDLIARF